MDGIISGIPEKLRPAFQYIPEFVRQGEPVALKPAIEKLLAFDNVDLLTGLVGYRSIVEFLPTIEKFKKTCLFADMGEYIPFQDYASDYMFFNSFQFWQAEYALGQWAQKEYGGKGAIFMPVYEAGYHMHSAFRMGVLSVSPSDMEYAMVPFDPRNEYSITDAMAEYMEKFRKERPTYLKAMFSGSEAVEFYSVFHREGLHKEIPLIVSPHMASLEILKQVEHLDMTFHSASLWNFQAEDPQNLEFKRRYVDLTGGMPNAFSLLGYEIGRALELIYPALKSRDMEMVRKVLREERIRTPRGERNFYLDSEYATPTIDIEKVRLEQNSIHKLVVNEGRALAYDHFAFEEIHRENVSGWFNNYLCV